MPFEPIEQTRQRLSSESILGSLASSRRPFDNEPGPGFWRTAIAGGRESFELSIAGRVPRPYERVEGYVAQVDDADIVNSFPSEYRDAFTTSQSPYDTLVIQSNLNFILENQEILARSPWGGVASFAGSVASVRNIGEMATGVAAFRKMGTAAKLIHGATIGGGTVGAGEALNEALLHQIDATRTQQESAWNIGLGTLFGVAGGTFGAALSDAAERQMKAAVLFDRRSVEIQDEVARRINDEGLDIYKMENAELNRYMMRTIEEIDPEWAAKAWREDTRFKRAIKTLLYGKSAVGRLESGTEFSRAFRRKNLDVPYLDDGKGATGVVVNSAIEGQYMRQAVAEGTMRNIYQEAKVATRVKAKDFFEDVGRAVRNGDRATEAVDPALRGYVERAAGEYRKWVDRYVTEPVLESGWLSRVDLEGDTSWLHRIYNRDAILADPDGFKGRVRDWLQKDGTSLKGEDLEAAVNRVFQKITGRPEGISVAGIVTDPNAVRDRTFRIPTSEIEEYVENDVRVVMRHIAKRLLPDVELARHNNWAHASLIQLHEYMDDVRTRVAAGDSVSVEEMRQRIHDLDQAVRYRTEFDYGKEGFARADRLEAIVAERGNLVRELSDLEGEVGRLAEDAGVPGLVQQLEEYAEEVQKLLRDRTRAQDLSAKRYKSNMRKIKQRKKITQKEMDLARQEIRELSAGTPDVKQRQRIDMLRQKVVYGELAAEIDDATARVASARNDLNSVRGKLKRLHEEHRAPKFLEELDARLTDLQRQRRNARAKVSRRMKKLEAMGDVNRAGGVANELRRIDAEEADALSRIQVEAKSFEEAQKGYDAQAASIRKKYNAQRRRVRSAGGEFGEYRVIQSEVDVLNARIKDMEAERASILKRKQFAQANPDLVPAAYTSVVRRLDLRGSESALQREIATIQEELQFLRGARADFFEPSELKRITDEVNGAEAYLEHILRQRDLAENGFRADLGTAKKLERAADIRRKLNELNEEAEGLHRPGEAKAPALTATDPDKQLGELMDRAASLRHREAKRAAGMEHVQAGLRWEGEQLKSAAIAAGKRSDINRIQRRTDGLVKDVKQVRDQMRNAYGTTENRTWVTATSNIMRLNAMTQMCGLMLTSIPDIAMGIITAGMGSYARALFKVFTTGPFWKTIKQLRKSDELATMASALELAGGDFGRGMRLGEIIEDAHAGTFTRGMEKATDMYFEATFINKWNSFWKSLNTLALQDRLIRDLRSWKTGGLTKASSLKLRRMGIDDALAARMLAQVDEFGGKHGALHLTGSQYWNDDTAKAVLESGVLKELRATIITPGPGEVPTFLSHPTTKFLAQFKNFSFSITDKVLIAGTQQGFKGRDVNFFLGVMGMVTLGMFTKVLKDVVRGREPKEMSWEQLLAEGVDRSGVLGILMDLNGMVERGTMGKFGLAPTLGLPPLTRWQLREFGGAFGPVIGAAEDFKRIAQSMFKDEEEFSRSDMRRILRRVPGNNLWYLQAGMTMLGLDDAEAYFADWFDLE